MLLKLLHDSLLPEIEAAWQREIQKCVAAYERGEAQVYVAEEVSAAVRRLNK